MRILHVGDDFAALRPCGLTLYSDALMQAQVAAGNDVSYFFSGRHYPWRKRPHIRRWVDRGVQMHELISSPIHSHWSAGTRDPLMDLDEPAGEAAFVRAVDEAQPEIVHIHELMGLPSSVIEQAQTIGVPIVMGLYDYKPLCPSVRLLDADGRRCMRREVGQDCARTCAQAPEGRAHLLNWTFDYEIQRAKRLVPLATRIDFTRAARLMSMAKGQIVGPATPGDSITSPSKATPSDYQRRRDVNIQRLSLCDRLIACSARVGEIYGELGVAEERMVVQRLTLPHLERLRPTRGPDVGTPLTFATLGGCAAPSKGSRLISDAVKTLERSGYSGRYQLLIFGYTEPAVIDELAGIRSVTFGGSTKAGDRYSAESREALDQADVGILPSTWEEAHGFVGIEMLAKGLPLIANPLGGIPEYVKEDETGWLNHSLNADGLAELMIAAIERPENVEHLRRSVRDRRNELVRPLDDHLQEVDRLYGEIVHQSTNATPSAR